MALSRRGTINMNVIMPQIPTSVIENAKRGDQDNTIINLSMAENWLIRPELIEICKIAMEKQLAPDVSSPYHLMSYRCVIVN